MESIIYIIKMVIGLLMGCLMIKEVMRYVKKMDNSYFMIKMVVKL